MILRSLALFLCLAAVAPLATACRRGAVMTPAEVDANGTHVFAASHADTFKATAGALQTLGYQLTMTDEGKGILKTDRKLLQARAVATSSVSASAVQVTRQYYVRITSTDATSTAVVAEPKVFIGERDVSGDEVWALEGPEGERELWRRLFAEIQSNL